MARAMATVVPFVVVLCAAAASAAVVSLKNQGYITPSTTTEIPWTERRTWSQRLQITRPKETPSPTSISWFLAEEGITFAVAMPANAEYGQLTFTNPHPEERSIVDVVVLWTNGTDFFAKDAVYVNGTIKEDKLENWVLETGQKNSTHLSFIFSRAWKTCDDDEDYPLGVDTAMMNWTIVVQTKDQIIFGKQGSGTINGSVEIQFWQPEMSREKAKQERYKTWELRLPQVKVDDDNSNLHWCQLFRTPRLDRKHWIIGFEPKLQNMEYIHRMILYECRADGEGTAELEKMAGKGGHCISDMRKAWAGRCDSLVTFMWAPGSEGTIFPEKRGIPIGGKHKETTFFLLKMQYDRPAGYPAVADRSGLDIFYTDRKGYTDAGSILVGHRSHPYMVLPPMKMDFVVRGWCTFEKDEIMGEKGMHIFSIMPMTNQAGRKVVLRHFREGQELKPIFKDEGFNYELQRHRKLPRDVMIMAGDTIVLECHYNTMNRDTLTYGGIMSNNEVCVAQILTTPPSSLLSCMSRPSRRSFLQAIHLKKIMGLEENLQTVHQLIEIKEDRDLEEESAVPATMSTNMSMATTRNQDGITKDGTMDTTHPTEATKSTISSDTSSTIARSRSATKATDRPERKGYLKLPPLVGVLPDIGPKMFDQLLVEEENADATAQPVSLSQYLQNMPKGAEQEPMMLNENLLMADYISYHILNGSNSELMLVSQVKAPMKIINLQNMTESCTGVWSSSLNEQAFLQNESTAIEATLFYNILSFLFIFIHF
ncbi:DBH-like monooxygenase protein 1 [Ischnura elegans]|uniref:DBH-like monooxygenase protein 1 n=1 Tax=Ischnura elegans TaxID=197161 RepID=UPI001ED88E20|nr:DBH-like monooxygenase protein 1 [Ischnura elegans]